MMTTLKRAGEYGAIVALLGVAGVQVLAACSSSSTPTDGGGTTTTSKVSAAGSSTTPSTSGTATSAKPPISKFSAVGSAIQ